MNRADRRRHGKRRLGEPGAKPEQDPTNMTLREMRLETPEASDSFLKLCYLDDAYKGSRDGGIRLPSIHESVSATASSGDMVYQAFPHGLMYGDQKSDTTGQGFLAVIMISPCFLAFMFEGTGLYGYRRCMGSSHG